jgi:LacI family transcriptional regulator
MVWIPYELGSYSVANIRDVARRAGVTPPTVSRVLNDNGYVKAETRQRVEAAIAELHYVPSSLGKSLRFQRTDTIGLLIADISNPFWVSVIRGAEHAASANGYNIILCDSDSSSEKEMRHLENLLRRQVDGVLITPIEAVPEPIQFVQARNVPVVVLNYAMSGVTVDIVRCDTEQAAYELVRLLIEKGHQRIAALSGPRNIITATDRVAGYKRAMEQAGLPIEPGLIQYDEFSPAGGYAMGRRMLELETHPTAVLTGNNFLAIGAAKAVGEAGLRIPQDISVVTFDGSSPDLVVDPFFTMAMQPGYDMGRRAAELLIKRLRAKTEVSTQEILLPTRIIEYQSTAPLIKT